MSGDDYEKYLEKARRYCTTAEKCDADVRTYLYKQNVDNNIIANIIDRLKNENYIDEERYVRAFVSDAYRFNKWGRQKIRFALSTKGISGRHVEQALSEIDEEEYLSVLKRLLETKAKSISRKSDDERRFALQRLGLSRGFEWDYIIMILDSEF